MTGPFVNVILMCLNFCITLLTRSTRDSETSIDFVQGPPGSRRERVNPLKTSPEYTWAGVYGNCVL